MNTYTVGILNPKAVRLLEDLADLQLITFNSSEKYSAELPETEKAAARERILQGSPAMNIDALLTHVRESRQDGKLPGRDERNCWTQI